MYSCFITLYRVFFNTPFSLKQRFPCQAILVFGSAPRIRYPTAFIYVYPSHRTLAKCDIIVPISNSPKRSRKRFWICLTPLQAHFFPGFSIYSHLEHSLTANVFLKNPSFCSVSAIQLSFSFQHRGREPVTFCYHKRSVSTLLVGCSLGWLV